MKRTTVVTILLAICLLVLAGSSWRVFSAGVGLRYDHEEAYAVGGATLNGPVESLDIHWIDGNVNLEYHGDSAVVISETSRKALSDDDQLRWWLDGTTLRIQYAKPGLRLKSGLGKALTLTLPEGVKLKDVGIHVTSGDVNIPALEADAVALDATSGNLSLTQTGSAQSVRLETTSGRITAALGDVGESRVTVTSGDIEQTFAAVGKAEISSTSGKIRVETGAFDELTIDATSGDVTAVLPETPGFTGEISATSGSLTSRIELAKDGKTYRCGDGSGKLSIHVTSGDIRLD